MSLTNLSRDCIDEAFFFPDGGKSDFGLLVFRGGCDSVDELEPVMICSTASVRLNDVLSLLSIHVLHRCSLRGRKGINQC